MIELVIILLIVLFVFGFIQIPGFTVPNWVLFHLNGKSITLLNILMVILVIWAIDLLPDPFRAVAGVLLIMWLLSFLGIIAIAGLTSLIEIAIIVGLVYYVVSKHRHK